MRSSEQAEQRGQGSWRPSRPATASPPAVQAPWARSSTLPPCTRHQRPSLSLTVVVGPGLGPLRRRTVSAPEHKLQAATQLQHPSQRNLRDQPDDVMQNSQVAPVKQGGQGCGFSCYCPARPGAPAALIAPALQRCARAPRRHPQRRRPARARRMPWGSARQCLERRRRRGRCATRVVAAARRPARHRSHPCAGTSARSCWRKRQTSGGEQL